MEKMNPRCYGFGRGAVQAALASVIICVLLLTCAPVKRGDFLRAPMIEYIESDPDAARRAAGALAALRACQAEVQSHVAEAAELRRALDECRDARIESERTAGKFDGLRAGAYGILGAIAAALVAATGWKLRRWFGSPI